MDVLSSGLFLDADLSNILPIPHPVVPVVFAVEADAAPLLLALLRPPPPELSNIEYEVPSVPSLL